MLDLDSLEEKAKDASFGPYYTTDSADGGYEVRAKAESGSFCIAHCGYASYNKADSEFLAECSPENILFLCEQARKVKAAEEMLAKHSPTG